MKTNNMKITMVTKVGLLVCSLLLSALVLTSCGVYSKVPPVNPEEMPNWSGPLVADADMEHVRIYIKGGQRTITLNMEDLNEDLRLLLAEYDQSKGETQGMVMEELSVNVPQSGNYVLVIEKTNQ